ncbi:Rv1733c family protein [Streptomyces clavifer]|uniref:Rv1733c family protein n=1 Tax=Streptomyces clavifer TaxID=68188 RepID=UPI0036497557
MRAGSWGRAGSHNPLKRGVDILETRLLFLLCAVVFGCASVLGVMNGMAALHHEQSVVEQQRATRHAVTAEILRDAAKPSPLFDESGRSERVPVPVRWTAAGGAHVTAEARVAPGAERGEHMTVWLDRTGRITSAPSDGRDIWATAVLGGLSGAAVAVGAGALAGVVLRVVCDRCRSAGWEAEWSRVEPEWNRRT